MIVPDPTLAAALVQPEAATAPFVFRDEALLGTRLVVSIIADSHARSQAAAIAGRAEIDRLNLILNSRDARSELVALNRAEAFVASPDLFNVIAAAERMRAATQGAFSGRLGALIDLWRTADATPDATRLADMASIISDARVELDAGTRTIGRPAAIRFALDGVAKGYIVDRALATIRAMPGIGGALVDIGGDIAASGAAPDGGWRIGLPDPALPFDNAPLVTSIALRDAAIATSGRGPRDRVIGGVRISPTLDPRTGQSVTRIVSASVIAADAMTADALASAMLVGHADDAISARVADALGAIAATRGWRDAEVETPELLRVQAKPGKWFANWQALATFTAPRRQLIRDPDFRSPYMAMWLTDLENKPVRTLILVGTKPDWQKDNYIWWQSNRAVTERLISARSMSTSGAGVYNVFWDGVDDAGKPVAPGRFRLHVETSRERGKHTYRQMELDFTTAQRFKSALEPTEEGGGIKVSFDHY